MRNIIASRASATRRAPSNARSARKCACSGQERVAPCSSSSSSRPRASAAGAAATTASAASAGAAANDSIARPIASASRRPGRPTSRASDESIGGNYARQGRRNQANTEQQLRREYGIGQRDGRRGGDWNRDGRGDRYGDRRDSRRGSWNSSWRNDNRYDWQRYRYSNRNLFRSGGYYAPYRNYRYNRLSIGIVLDSLFYSNRYWLSDPYQYRLPPAPYGTQWVRYYDDVVLVDIYTGEVLDVIENFFW